MQPAVEPRGSDRTAPESMDEQQLREHIRKLENDNKALQGDLDDTQSQRDQAQECAARLEREARTIRVSHLVPWLMSLATGKGVASGW